MKQKIQADFYLNFTISAPQQYTNMPPVEEFLETFW